ncbi:MAG: phosphatase PAP2 family protein [Eubacteriales bacterium]|nr:phosphatase PAP2 family protein [Eubacteriales bacterium]
MITLQQIDMSILLWIQEHLRIDALTPFWKVITFLGNGGWFWLVAAAVLLIPKKTRRTGIVALLSMTIGFLITNLLLKNIVARPRPFDTYTEIIPLITRPTDFSFPSGHTCASFACALVFFRMLPEKYGIPAVILAGMVAFSRLYLGVHYPGDVLGGFLVAVFASILAYYLVQTYREKTEKGKNL